MRIARENATVGASMIVLLRVVMYIILIGIIQ